MAKDPYENVYKAVLAMLQAGESDESVDDAINAAYATHRNEVHEREAAKDLAS